MAPQSDTETFSVCYGHPMTYTDTALIPTPAADRLAEREPILKAAIEAQRTYMESTLRTNFGKADLVAKAKVMGISTAGSPTKADLVTLIADSGVMELGDWKSLDTLRAEARRESKIIAAIAQSRQSVTLASQRIANLGADLVADKPTYGPEAVVDLGLALARARVFAGHYDAVANVSLNNGMTVTAALDEIAKAVIAEVVSEAVSASRMSSDAARNAVIMAERSASAAWLREIRPMSPGTRLALSY